MILNFGSINIDYVYRLAQLPSAGETLATQGFARYLGGKGINQSIAIARAGGAVRHIGAVGADGDWALAQIAAAGLDTGSIRRVETPTGHAVICLDTQGENHIIIHAGANGALEIAQVEAALATPNTHWVVLQNETNLTAEIARAAKAKDLSIAYSAAPFDAQACLEILPHIDILAVNESEAAALADSLKKPLDSLKIPRILITKGASGAEILRPNMPPLVQKGFTVKAIDTVGAGDTFFGSFIARLQQNDSEEVALRYAAAAAALQVSRKGAAQAIPSQSEVLKLLKE